MPLGGHDGSALAAPSVIQADVPVLGHAGNLFVGVGGPGWAKGDPGHPDGNSELQLVVTDVLGSKDAAVVITASTFLLCSAVKGSVEVPQLEVVLFACCGCHIDLMR